MAFVKKSQALGSIKTRLQTANGEPYRIYESYLGMDAYRKRPVRLYARTEDALRRKIADFYRRVDAGGEVAVVLSPYQTMDAKNALDLLAQNNRSLSLTECVKMVLGGEAALAMSCTTTLGDALRKYLAAQSGKSPAHQRAVSHRVGSWVQTFGAERLLSEVTAKEVSAYLAERFIDPDRPETKTTYNNNLNYIKTFMKWCADPEQRFVARSDLAAMKSKAVGYRDPAFVPAAQVRRLFAALESDAAPETLADAILSFFCGMRQAEIQRVALGEDAVAINLDERYIRVIKCKGTLHGVSPRAFTIPDAALRWMRSFDFIRAARTPNPHFRERLAAAAAKCGVALPPNAGRHTFITMFAAAYHDQNLLTSIVGNTEAMRSRHYDGRTSQKEGLDYFSIAPTAPA